MSICSKPTNEMDCSTWTYLGKLISDGYCKKAMDFMKENNIDPSQKVEGNYVLISAAHFNNQKLVKRLLKTQRIPDVLDSEGWSAVVGAIHSGSDEMLEIILEAGFRMDRSPIDCLRLAAHLDFNSKSVFRLIQLGASCENVQRVDDTLTAHFVAAGWQQELMDEGFSNPSKVFSLKDIARNCVRSCVRKDRNLVVQVQKLSLPTSLKSYLLYNIQFD